MSGAWHVRLANQAEQDILEIADWTTEHFRPQQADIYAETIALAITALLDGPNVIGSKTRDEIDTGIRTLHVGRQKRKGSHFVVYREAPDRIIDVLRILHDSMEMKRHIDPLETKAH